VELAEEDDIALTNLTLLKLISTEDVETTSEAVFLFLINRVAITVSPIDTASLSLTLCASLEVVVLDEAWAESSLTR
jgi:hypothetical protein